MPAHTQDSLINSVAKEACGQRIEQQVQIVCISAATGNLDLDIYVHPTRQLETKAVHARSVGASTLRQTYRRTLGDVGPCGSGAQGYQVPSCRRSPCGNSD